jgi:hypothetical protein
MSLTYDSRFEQWMSTPPQDGSRLIEGVYIYGNVTVGNYRFAKGIYDAPGVYPDENGVQQTWGQMNFELQLPTLRNSLQLEMTLTLDGLEPNTIAMFDRIPPEALSNLIYIRLYAWLDPTAMDVPLVTPPPRFIVDEITLSTTAVQLQCSGPLLPNYRAGKLYTVEEYPGLQTGT